MACDCEWVTGSSSTVWWFGMFIPYSRGASGFNPENTVSGWRCPDRLFWAFCPGLGQAEPLKLVQSQHILKIITGPAHYQNLQPLWRPINGPNPDRCRLVMCGARPMRIPCKQAKCLELFIHQCFEEGFRYPGPNFSMIMESPGCWIPRNCLIALKREIAITDV